jgi:hypothetical protein
MAGLVPAIHVFPLCGFSFVDHRDGPGDDESQQPGTRASPLRGGRNRASDFGRGSGRFLAKRRERRRRDREPRGSLPTRNSLRCRSANFDLPARGTVGSGFPASPLPPARSAGRACPRPDRGVARPKAPSAGGATRRERSRGCNPQKIQRHNRASSNFARPRPRIFSARRIGAKPAETTQNSRFLAWARFTVDMAGLQVHVNHVRGADPRRSGFQYLNSPIGPS